MQPVANAGKRLRVSLVRLLVTGHFAPVTMPSIFESFSALQAITQNKRDSNVIETFRFKDENDYEYEI